MMANGCAPRDKSRLAVKRTNAPKQEEGSMAMVNVNPSDEETEDVQPLPAPTPKRSIVRSDIFIPNEIVFNCI